MKKTDFKLRQGDVILTEVKSIPKGQRKVRKDGALAYGEVTGHKHAVMSPETADVFEIDGQVFLCVNERGISIEGDVAKLLPEAQRIAGDESETSDRRDKAERLIKALPQAGAILVHGTDAEVKDHPIPAAGKDRHWPIAVPPGQHKSLIQSEYSPEAIRDVID